MADQAGAVADKTQDQSKKYKIKVQGQEKEVSESELIELAQKGDDYTLKTQKLSDKEKALEVDRKQVEGLKSIVDEMEANPKLKETLNKVYSDFKSGKISTSDNADKNLKKIDKLIEDAETPEEREKLRDVKTIVTELAEDIADKKTSDRVRKLEEEISLLKDVSLNGITERVDKDIKQLEDKFGIDLVGKYRADLKTMALKYPKNTVSKIFKHICEDSEYEKAVLDVAKRSEQNELERKKRGSSPSAGDFIAKTPLAKDRAGRVTADSIKSRILERLGLR